MKTIVKKLVTALLTIVLLMSICAVDAMAADSTIVITKQPVNYVGAVGSTATFTVEATGTNLKYQWQWHKAGESTWTNTSVTGNKTNTISMEMTAARVGNVYRCMITDASGTPVYTDSVELVKATEATIVITKQPKNYVGPIGSTATFRVEVTGTNLSYQWQWHKPGATTWTNTSIAGNKTNTISMEMTAARVGNVYRCVITDGTGLSINTDEVTLIEGEASGFRITMQPTDYVGAIGSTATISVQAEGNGLNYQWQWHKAGATKWTDTTVTGCQTNTITMTMTAARVGNVYRCVITDENGDVITSESAALVDGGDIEFAITKQPKDYIGEVGSTATFTVEATGTALKYQWQWHKPGASTWTNTSVTGYKTNTITMEMTASRVGNVYRCMITDANGEVIYSDPATLTKAASVVFEITKQPVDYTGDIGSTATFSVIATGSDLTYQWQWHKPGATTWSNTSVTGCKTDTITMEMTAARVGNVYRCKISNGTETIYSDPVTLIQNTVVLPEITTQPVDYVGPVGSTATFTLEATGTGLTYQWQWHKAGATTWKNTTVSGYDTNTITMELTAARVGNVYRCMITDANGEVIYSDPATLVEKTAIPLAITTQPVDYVGEVGSTATFSLEATGENITYQWQWHKAGATSWTNTTVTGYNTNTITMTMSSGRVGNVYRCIITDENGEFITSNEVTLIKEADELLLLTDVTPTTTILEGTTTDLAIEVSDATATYQWYKGTPNTTITVANKNTLTNYTWNAISGATGADYTVNASSAGTEYYYCKGTKGTATVESSVASVEIIPVLAVTESADLVQYTNTATEIGVTVTSSNTRLEYQWYKGTAKGTITDQQDLTQYNWNPITTAGTNVATISVESNTEGEIFYYCAISENVCDQRVTSRVIRITYRDPIALVSETGNNLSVVEGGSATFAVSSNKAEGEVAYTWAYSEDGSTYNVLSGETSNSITVSTAGNYRVTAVDTLLPSNSINEAFTLTVYEPAVITITAQPQRSITANEGVSYNFTVAADLTGGIGTEYLIYQWQVKTADGSWVNIESANTNTYSVIATDDTVNNLYRCVVSANDSNVASVTTEAGALIKSSQWETEILSAPGRGQGLSVMSIDPVEEVTEVVIEEVSEEAAADAVIDEATEEVTEEAVE